MWGNPLIALPLEIARLARLSYLNLGRNQMLEIPPGVWRLSSLERLVIDHTQVSSIPPDIKYLRNLEYVELHNNRLSGLPPEIGELDRLMALVLHSNAITYLPPEIGALRRLRQLDVHHNQLVSLPVEIGKLENLDRLDLTENPLPVPPEILAHTEEPATVITYYLQHLGGQKRPLNEAKMVLVGQGGVGKTSLVRRLTANTYDAWEPKTEGIDIQAWTVHVNDADVQLNVWDFGGQEIMHATHQFFLTKRTLYLLVLDGRLTEEENRLEYWLKIIQSFGSDSPVIVVANKSDLHAMDLDGRGLPLKYPQIRAIIGTSCATGMGIDKLKARIVREISRMPHLRDALLESWFEVKREIEALDKDYMTYESYLELCQSHGVTDERSQRTLIGFLHDLGIVLNFQDDPRLEDTNILNPQWVTNGVYRILNDEGLRRRNGLLDRSDLGRILDHHAYPRHRHQFVLDMMRKFELCFPFDDVRSDRFLVPDLLSKEAPDTGVWTNSLAFQYHYSVLPGSVISRFIVRMHPYIDQESTGDTELWWGIRATQRWYKPIGRTSGSPFSCEARSGRGARFSPSSARISTPFTARSRVSMSRRRYPSQSIPRLWWTTSTCWTWRQWARRALSLPACGNVSTCGRCWMASTSRSRSEKLCASARRWSNASASMNCAH